jgi:hypothetical protein
MSIASKSRWTRFIVRPAAGSSGASDRPRTSERFYTYVIQNLRQAQSHFVVITYNQRLSSFLRGHS